MNKPDKSDHSYTPNQVAALVEDLKSEFRAVTEVVTTLSEDMTDVKERLSSLEVEVRSMKDVIQVAIPDHEKRIQRLEKKVGV